MFTLNRTYTFMNPNHKPSKVPDSEQSEQSQMGELWLVNAQVAFLQFKHLNSLQLYYPDSKKSHSQHLPQSCCASGSWNFTESQIQT